MMPPSSYFLVVVAGVALACLYLYVDTWWRMK